MSLRGFKEKYDLDPKRLETIEERLETIKKLEKKYGDGTDSIIRYRDEAEKELSTLKHSDEKLTYLKNQLREKEEKLLSEATHL